MIKVLIADDSSTYRALLREMFNEEDGFSVIGEARDGLEAVELTLRLKPDVIVMDLNMPNMDGLHATEEIMFERPTPIVICSASPSIGEAATAMKGLTAGALNLMMKPSVFRNGQEQTDDSVFEFKKSVRLMSAIKVFRRVRKKHSATESPPASSKVVSTGTYCLTKGSQRPSAAVSCGAFSDLHLPTKRPRVIAIASSTGGPPALLKLLEGLPVDYGIPIMIVQHIGSGFVSGMADWLNRSVKSVGLTVKVAAHGERLQPRMIYLAPDGVHMGLNRADQIQLSTAAAINGFRPSATHLFESVAASIGAECVAVVLTGMGNDGVKGLELVKNTGGFVIAQDEASSVVFGMPKEAIQSGRANIILPLDAMSSFLKRLGQI